MTDTAPQTQSANGSPSEPARESIDPVRDLLFGSQMRMVDARIQSLDERLNQETSSLRADFDRRITDLDGTIRNELVQHASRLDSERAKRVEELKALGAELRELLKSLDERHRTFAQAAGQADAELRDHLMSQSAAFTADLAKTAERISAELDRITTGLRTDKLDVAALVAGLTDLAGRLGGAAPPVKRAQRS
jgi:hypothetical protein